MATKAKDALVSAFLKLIETEKYEKITVTSLVEECSISRQTFYYHFDDIEKMLEWSFKTESDKICAKLNIYKWSDSALMFVDLLNKYDEFLRKISASASCMFGYNLLYKAFYDYTERYIELRHGRKTLQKEETRFFISYTASSFCGLVLLEIQKDESNYDELYGKIVKMLTGANKQ